MLVIAHESRKEQSLTCRLTSDFRGSMIIDDDARLFIIPVTRCSESRPVTYKRIYCANGGNRYHRLAHSTYGFTRKFLGT